MPRATLAANEQTQAFYPKNHAGVKLQGNHGAGGQKGLTALSFAIMTQETYLKKPPWLRKRLPSGPEMANLERSLRKRRLYTICEEGQCPNRAECFGRKVATFLILGANCTRNCAFCAVATGGPTPLDPEEPANVANEAAELGLKFVVVTSVTRDDLPDGGAAHYAATIRALKARIPGMGVEVLTPDFKGSEKCIATVLEATPEVFAHNVETTPALHRAIRPQADYRRSLGVLASASRLGARLVKSGFMLGLGETKEDVERVMADLLEHGCGMLTIGQYLRPAKANHPVVEYIHPDVFAEYEAKAREMGFDAVASGPFVRSSYLAEHYFHAATVEAG